MINPEWQAEHSWDVSPKQAMRIQQSLRDRVITEDCLPEVNYVAGVDVGYIDAGRITRAAVALLAFPALTLSESAVAHLETRFPYVPGLLSFRELPAIMQALGKLRGKPDLFLCDGQGLAHPRRFGIACHLGILTGIPSIGVGKSRLLGTHDVPADKRGAWEVLQHKNEIIGAVLRTREGVNPIYVSIGHKVSLLTAIDYVMHCLTKYKLPETTRFAHNLASRQVSLTGKP